jgi:hypothetical protein
MPVTIGQLIAEIDSVMPNRISTSTKILWANREQQKLYDLYSPVVIDTQLKTIQYQNEYQLPTNIKLENIQKVLVGSLEVSYNEFGDETLFPYYYEYVDPGYLVLSPIPETADLSIAIHHTGRPITLAAETTEVQLPEPYHEVIIESMYIRIAKSLEDIDLVNAHTIDYNNALSDAMLSHYNEDNPYVTTEDVMYKRRGEIYEDPMA